MELQDNPIIISWYIDPTIINGSQLAKIKK